MAWKAKLETPADAADDSFADAADDLFDTPAIHGLRFLADFLDRLDFDRLNRYGHFGFEPLLDSLVTIVPESRDVLSESAKPYTCLDSPFQEDTEQHAVLPTERKEEFITGRPNRFATRANPD